MAAAGKDIQFRVIKAGFDAAQPQNGVKNVVLRMRFIDLLLQTGFVNLEVAGKGIGHPDQKRDVFLNQRRGFVWSRSHAIYRGETQQDIYGDDKRS